MKPFTGRLTVVMTPELRELAYNYVITYGPPTGVEDRDIVKEWFRDQETPDGHLLDAAYSEAEALMILVIASALHDLHEHNLPSGDEEDQLVPLGNPWRPDNGG